MRIVQITAGTGSFHCGTCMRDNALVHALRAGGHDAVLAPLYLPLVLDEADASGGVPLFYGGVNVYLQQRFPFFRHSPRWLDRLFDSRWLLRAAAGRTGMTSPRDLGEITLSTLQGEEGCQEKELARLTAWLRSEVRPDAILLSNLLLAGLARRLKQSGARVLCFLQGEDSFLDGLPEPYRARAWQAAAARAADIDLFLPVSRWYGAEMRRRLNLAEDQVQVIYPGLLLDDYQKAAAPPVPTAGYLARICRAKGLESLVEAFLKLHRIGRPPGARLEVGGSLTHGDTAWAEGLIQRVQQSGASASLHPNLSREEKIAFLQGLTALCVPALYGEAFGLYWIEANAAGIPVVAPDHAGFPEIQEMTQGGLLYDPEDAGALPQALEQALTDPALRARAESAREQVHRQFSSRRMAEEVAAACRPVSSA